MMVNNGDENHTSLQVNGLETWFNKDGGKPVRAVGGIDLQLYKGEMLGIVGESGSGKSVLAKSILKILSSSGEVVNGSVMFEGKDLLALSDKEMLEIRGKKMTMIFQEPLSALNPSFTIGWQIAEVYRLHEKISKKKAKKKTLDMLRKVKIPDPEERMNAYPHELSGGMQQRVLIAIALAFQPEVLIADEPTTALDVTVQDEIMELLLELHETMNVSILFISHDLNLVIQRCSRVMVMYAGEIMEIADSRTLAKNPLNPYTNGLMNAMPDVDHPELELITIPGEISNVNVDKHLCPFLDRCTKSFDKCFSVKPELRGVEENHYVRCHLY